MMKKTFAAVSTAIAVSAFAVAHLSAQTEEQLLERAEQRQQQKYEVMQVNTELFQGSAAAIKKYVADDAVFATDKGVSSMSKADLLKRVMLKRTQHSKPVRLNVIQVTPQDETAIIVGFYTVEEQKANKRLTWRGTFLNVFAKRNSRWQLIAQQTSGETQLKSQASSRS